MCKFVINNLCVLNPTVQFLLNAPNILYNFKQLFSGDPLKNSPPRPFRSGLETDSANLNRVIGTDVYR